MHRPLSEPAWLCYSNNPEVPHRGGVYCPRAGDPLILARSLLPAGTVRVYLSHFHLGTRLRDLVAEWRNPDPDPTQARRHPAPHHAGLAIPESWSGASQPDRGDSLH